VRSTRKRKRLRCVLILPIILAVAFSGCSLQNIGGKIFSRQNEMSGQQIVLKPAGRKLSVGINSPNAILVRLSDYSVLLDKNSKERVYPASLTKMMTAVVAIENLPNLDEKIVLPTSMFKPLYQADASLAGFQGEEEVSARDLLYGALLPSGAECCLGLAEKAAGSEESFVKLMNQKAKQLGMSSTHFANTTGLHNENHYTTVQDLAVLLSYALKNNTFRQIFTTEEYNTAPTNKHADGVAFVSTMFQKLKSNEISGGKILGGKTGFTNEAGLCLASLAQKNGKEYILVTAGAKGNHATEQYHLEDAKKIYNAS